MLVGRPICFLSCFTVVCAGMDYRQIITVEPGKRGGKPCVRGLRITVYEVLKMLASEMTFEEILRDYPDLTREDILACIQYASEREHVLNVVSDETSV